MRFTLLLSILLMQGCSSLPLGGGSTQVKPSESKADRMISEKGERITEKNTFYFRYYPKDYNGIIIQQLQNRRIPNNK